VGYKAVNNATSALAAALTTTETSVQITTGTGEEFPPLTGVGDFTYITVYNTSGVVEIMKVTAVLVDTLTVLRGQDGTTALAWNVGDMVDCRPCAGAINAKLDADGTSPFTGPVTLEGNPTEPLQAAPKQYVDAAVAQGGASIPALYNLTEAEAIGGYPVGVILRSASTTDLYWANQSAGNISNPDAQGANWIPLAFALDNTKTFQAAVTSANVWSGALGYQIAETSDLQAVRLIFYAPANNTGPVTLNVNGSGAYPVVQSNMVLAGGEMYAGSAYAVTYLNGVYHLEYIGGGGKAVGVPSQANHAARLTDLQGAIGGLSGTFPTLASLALAATGNQYCFEMPCSGSPSGLIKFQFGIFSATQGQSGSGNFQQTFEGVVAIFGQPSGSNSSNSEFTIDVASHTGFNWSWKSAGNLTTTIYYLAIGF
jgi:hypothetical protein